MDTLRKGTHLLLFILRALLPLKHNALLYRKSVKIERGEITLYTFHYTPLKSFIIAKRKLFAIILLFSTYVSAISSV